MRRACIVKRLVRLDDPAARLAHDLGEIAQLCGRAGLRERRRPEREQRIARVDQGLCEERERVERGIEGCVREELEVNDVAVDEEAYLEALLEDDDDEGRAIGMGDDIV